MQVRPQSLTALLALALTCLAITSQAAPTKRVAVKSNARADFIEARQQNDFAPLTYVFAKGEFFSDSKRGNSIAKIDFQTIAETLATDLAKQNFLPTTDIEKADLLLVVHWGGIERLEDPTKLMAIEKAYEDTRKSIDTAGSDYVSYDAMETRFDLVQSETDTISERMTDAKMAKLLGFDEDLARERKKVFSSSLEETLLTQMQQERFLVIITAWDNQAMRKSQEKKLLWSAHLSMKALGTNFQDAIAFMSGAAADYYGTQSEGITSHLYKREEYEIKMGEIEVVESGKNVQLTQPSKTEDEEDKEN